VIILHLEGETGRIVAGGAPQLLAAGMDEFMVNSAAGKLSATGVRGPVLKFGWDTVASAIVDEYAALQREYHGVQVRREAGRVSLLDTSCC
jgi:hypothetical protein